MTAGAYINERRVHTRHEFFPAVPPGYKIIEVPSQVIYLPITVKTIDHLQVPIVDQDGNLVNFRGEIVTIRPHQASLMGIVYRGKVGRGYINSPSWRPTII